MSPQTITCALCGLQINKRQSLSLETLGIGQGRACRGHPEIQELIVALQSKQKLRWELDKAQLKMRIMSAASMVRVLHTAIGLPTDRLYMKLEIAGLKPEEIQMVRREVDRLGGPLMGEDEALMATITAMDILRRQSANAS